MDDLSKLDGFTPVTPSVQSTETDTKEVKDSATITSNPDEVIVTDSKTTAVTRKLPKDPKARKETLLFEQRLSEIEKSKAN